MAQPHTIELSLARLYALTQVLCRVVCEIPIFHVGSLDRPQGLMTLSIQVDPIGRKYNPGCTSSLQPCPTTQHTSRNSASLPHQRMKSSLRLCFGLIFSHELCMQTNWYPLNASSRLSVSVSDSSSPMNSKCRQTGTPPACPKSAWGCSGHGRVGRPGAWPLCTSCCMKWAMPCTSHCQAMACSSCLGAFTCHWIDWRWVEVGHGNCGLVLDTGLFMHPFRLPACPLTLTSSIASLVPSLYKHISTLKQGHLRPSPSNF